MAGPSRMPRYDVRNDGVGPYAVFYCDSCDREFRSQPDVVSTVTKDVGRKALGGLLRNIPLVGGVAADRVESDDPRYTYSLTPEQTQKAWDQMVDRFQECPTCQRIVCPTCWDEKSGFCTDDSPRSTEIAEAQAEQAGAMLKGFASALGLGEVARQAAQAAKQATASAARCPVDGTLAPAGTKFCPECGTAMVQPAADPCPKLRQGDGRRQVLPRVWDQDRPQAGRHLPQVRRADRLVKFCPECGQKLT